MILGLTGSFGSGKSTVAEMLTALADAHVIDADVIARQLQAAGQPGLAQIVEAFGPQILSPNEELDRRKLAGIVFGNKKQLQRLNAIIHPLVWDEEVRQLELHKDCPLRVLMVPLLFETGTEKLCNKVAVVTVSEDQRAARLATRDNLSDEQIRQRLTAQMSQEEKERRADYVIDNSGSLEETEAQIRTMLKHFGFVSQPIT